MVTTDLVALAAKSLHARKNRSSRYVDDPVGFVNGVLDEHLWSKQREIMESVRDHRHTAVHSCHDSGKSYVAARVAAWWLSVHPPGTAFVVTSAPSFAQVRAILWREINRAHRKGKLQGETNQTEWWIDGEIVAYGRKPADYDETAFQGIHARYVLVILDEAGGIPKQLWDAAETITTNENSRILAIGNPDSPLSQFKRVCDSDTWNVIHIDGLETPNFTDEFELAIQRGELTEERAHELRDVLLSRVWVAEREDEWGKESNLYESKVRGRFPLVPVGQVYKELNPSLQWAGPLPRFKRLVGGIDIGNADEQAHRTAAVVAGLAEDDSIDLKRLSVLGAKGVLVRTHHFEHASPLVYDDLIQWMRDVQHFYGRGIEWRMDKSQMLGAYLLTKEFNITPTHGGAGSVSIGINMQRRRMEVASSFFTADLMHPPKFLSGDRAGQTMDGKAWYERMTNLRWKQQPDEDKKVPGVPIERDDDTCDGDRYLHEAADGFPSVRGPAVAQTTIDGVPVTGKVD